MAKSPEMERELNRISTNMFGRKRTDTIDRLQCVTCGGDAHDFRDELSAREYRISGMCQQCQDEVFGMGGDE